MPDSRIQLSIHTLRASVRRLSHLTHSKLTTHSTATLPLPQCALAQKAPTFLAPGMDFVEDDFSTDIEWQETGGGAEVVMQT